MEVTYSHNIFSLNLEGKIDYTLPFSYEEIISKSSSNTFEIIELNFSKTKFITLAGALYLLFIVSSVVKSKRTFHSNIETIITNCSDNIMEILASFDF